MGHTSPNHNIPVPQLYDKGPNRLNRFLRYSYNQEPQNRIGNCSGPYIRGVKGAGFM